MIRAVTEIDSGRDRDGCGVGVGVDLKASSRFCNELDLDLSRIFDVSGDESPEMEGEVWFRVRELARSAMDGDLEGARTLPFRTEKNAGDAPGVGPVVPAGGVELDSFSKALILCDIPDPRLTDLAMGFDGS